MDKLSNVCGQLRGFRLDAPCFSTHSTPWNRGCPLFLVAQSRPTPHFLPERLILVYSSTRPNTWFFSKSGNLEVDFALPPAIVSNCARSYLSGDSRTANYAGASDRNIWSIIRNVSASSLRLLVRGVQGGKPRDFLYSPIIGERSNLNASMKAYPAGVLGCGSAMTTAFLKRCTPTLCFFKSPASTPFGLGLYGGPMYPRISRDRLLQSSEFKASSIFGLRRMTTFGLYLSM